MQRLNKYVIRGETRNRKQELVYEMGGKIRSLEMPDIEGDLPGMIIYARRPTEAIKKYWGLIGVEPRSAELYVRLAGSYKERRYIVDWASWNECGCGQTGWWVLLNSDEYKLLRHDDGFAIFGLPDSRFLGYS